ncbi:DUF4407 domain-containing protein [Lentzea albida]|uniref:Serine/threonine protein kinase n=1 Tax=Lentzea albida TaxID=65499 RepID=A0A1H9TLZ1_9PSEU|nr:DUF4407 domain-containing protein [Lentzea albida]SER98142.1 Serine/threonine protein kinase [Lentzea albida]
MNSPGLESDVLATAKPRWPLQPIWLLGNGFAWLGGASWRGITSRHDRSSYQLSGFFVLLNGFIAWGLFSLAAVGMGVAPSFAAALPYTFAWGLFVALFDRAISARTVDPSQGKGVTTTGYVVRGLVACMLGFIIAEAGAMAFFRDDIERTMRDTISRQVQDSAVGVLGTQDAPTARAAALDEMRGQRDKLQNDLTAAEAKAAEAGRIAVCEREPDGCDDLVRAGKVTGKRGEGDKTRLRDAEKAAAEAERDKARQEWETKGKPLDPKISELEKKLAEEVGVVTTAAQASQGMPARWRAMLDFTRKDPAAAFLHLLIVVFCVLLDLVPLLLKIWRGQTGYDMNVVASRNLTRARLDRAVIKDRLTGDAEIEEVRVMAAARLEIVTKREKRRVEAALARLDAEPLPDDEPAAPVEQPGPADRADSGAEPDAGEDMQIPDHWSDEDRELVTHLFAGRYRAIEPLEGADRGAFGRMLLGRDLQTRKRVVIKAVRDQEGDQRKLFRSPLRRMWQREIEAAAKLHHQNIGQILASGRELGYLWTVSPLYQPGSLVQWIESTTERSMNAYTLRHSIDHVLQLTRALVHAHNKKVTHGDIKPTNAVLDGPTLMLVDWGFARVLNQVEQNDEAFGGTPLYTAPEALLRRDFDAELADVYSIGATWYFLLTGRPPYHDVPRDLGAKEIARRISDGKVKCERLDELVPALPSQVVSLVHDLIEVVPRHRLSFDRDERPAMRLERAIKEIEPLLGSTSGFSAPVGPEAAGRRSAVSALPRTLLEDTSSQLDADAAKPAHTATNGRLETPMPTQLDSTALLDGTTRLNGAAVPELAATRQEDDVTEL